VILETPSSFDIFVQENPISLNAWICNFDTTKRGLLVLYSRLPDVSHRKLWLFFCSSRNSQRSFFYFIFLLISWQEIYNQSINWSINFIRGVTHNSTLNW
jgi:hypothetical protein